MSKKDTPKPAKDEPKEEKPKEDKVKDNKSKEKAEPKTKKKHTGLIVSLIISGIVILAAVAVVLFFVFRKETDISTTKIMERIAQKLPSITDVINYSEVDDPNEIMGQPNQYTSKSSWEDNRIYHSSEFAGTIEVFNNTKDAELREQHLAKYRESCEQAVSAEKYGSAIKSGWNCEDYRVFRKDAVVIRLSVAFSENQMNEYMTEFENIIDKFVVPEKDVPSLERINELREQSTKQLEDAYSVAFKEIESGLDEMINTYIDKLDSLLVTLNEDELAGAKEELKFYKEASYFSAKIPEIEQKIKDIENKIAEKKKQDEEAAAKAEAEQLAKKNRTLSTGRYEVCSDIESGTYDVTATSGSGNLYVDSTSYSHYVNEIMSSDGSYGWIKEYKNMILSCGDTLQIKNGLTIRITAKK